MKNNPIVIKEIINGYFVKSQKQIPSIHVHFIGIGGIGVSALARWFLSHGAIVSGSDSSKSALTETLEKEGVAMFSEKNAEHIKKNIDLVVFSNAVATNHPERKTAERLGIPSASYPEVIGELTKHYKTIAVSGMHGKSTTASMIASILIHAGLDPTVIIGVTIENLGGKNFRNGNSPFLILEADEYAKALLNYLPTISIVTNLDEEHLEIYGSMTNIKKTFLQYFSQTQRGGTLILNKENKNLLGLKKEIEKIAKQRELKIIWYVTKKELAQSVRVTGAHNLSNATAAYEVSQALNISKTKITDGLKTYHGAWRRMELRGKLIPALLKGKKVKKALVFDDYAHHPTEIEATLSAFKMTYPRSKTICVFQPHQAKRLALLFKKFEEAFKNADGVILLPTYIVTGRDEINNRYTSQTLCKAIKKHSPAKPIFYAPDFQDIPERIAEMISDIKTKETDDLIIIMMGAGAIFLHTQNLLK